MENGAPGAGEAVLDRLPSWGGPMYVSERLRPGVLAQLGLVYDPWVTLQCHPKGRNIVPWAAHATPFAPSRDANQGGPHFHKAPPGGSKITGVRGEMQCMYIGGSMEAHQHKSLHDPRNHVVPADPPLPWALDQGKPPGVLPTMSVDGQNGH